MLKIVKKKLRQFLLKQILFELYQGSPETLKPIAQNVRLSLGIPSSLGKPLGESVGTFNQHEFTKIFLQNYLNKKTGSSLTIDLGCGTQPQNPFFAEQVFGCDLQQSPNSNVISADLFNEPIPFKDNYFDYATAFDFIEHLPRVLNSSSSKVRFPFIEFMDEVHRVLKPGALFFARTPAILSKEAFQDPTHVNFITEDTFPSYFCLNQDGQPHARIYGFNGTFELIAQEWCRSWLFTLIKKK